MASFEIRWKRSAGKELRKLSQSAIGWDTYFVGTEGLMDALADDAFTEYVQGKTKIMRNVNA